jgi:hypothetical protein
MMTGIEIDNPFQRGSTPYKDIERLVTSLNQRSKIKEPTIRNKSGDVLAMMIALPPAC